MKNLGLAFAALAGLAATPAVAQSQDETIAYSTRKAQPMVAGSSFRNVFLFGAVGGFVADRVDGRLIAREYDVRDPQDDIALAVATEIADRRGVEVADGPVDVGSLSRRALARSQPPGRYLVDVESTQREFMWSLIRGQWIRYTVGYKANLAVLDVPNREYVVRDRCRWSSPKADRASRAYLLDNGAAHLKAQFAIAADTCTAQFVNATQSLWRANERPVAEERAPHRMPPPAPVAVAPLPVETHARVVYAAPRPLPPPPPVYQYSSQYSQHSQPVIVEYAYARPDAAPPARQPEYDARYAGRDASGFLTWSGKRP